MRATDDADPLGNSTSSSI